LGLVVSNTDGSDLLQTGVQFLLVHLEPEDIHRSIGFNQGQVNHLLPATSIVLLGLLEGEIEVEPLVKDLGRHVRQEGEAHLLLVFKCLAALHHLWELVLSLLRPYSPGWTTEAICK
jgi:hypothetical protein